MASIFCDCRNCSSRDFRSVMSVPTPSKCIGRPSAAATTRARPAIQCVLPSGQTTRNSPLNAAAVAAARSTDVSRPLPIVGMDQRQEALIRRGRLVPGQAEHGRQRLRPGKSLRLRFKFPDAHPGAAEGVIGALLALPPGDRLFLEGSGALDQVGGARQHLAFELRRCSRRSSRRTP